MSEYQHYQFLAVDRPLTDEQVAEIRTLTSRAALTRTTFVNTYQWGDFKGNCDRLMEQYYDAHLYFANWGYRKVILRWPAEQLPLHTAQQYCTGESADARRHGGHVLITLVSDDEDGELDDFNDLFDFDGYEDTGREEEWLPSIARARLDVAAGDVRLLYLAWLHCLNNNDLDDTDVEPELPAGLADLPDSLTDLADFLRIDPDLITAASASLPHAAPEPTRAMCESWVGTLPQRDKDATLVRLLRDDDSYAAADLRRRFRLAHPGASPRKVGRTVAQLRAAVHAVTAERLAREAQEEAEREEAERQKRRADRQRRLAALQDDPEAAWGRIHEMIAYQKGRNYPAAVQLLGDLSALADRDGTSAAFAERCRALRGQHHTKRALQRLLDAAGL
ncbi:hypothetical protein GCM10010277_85000 [Streptomyces longisporoflavus]|uniref:hypothetical protein n=1 Tax=Streptomyces longisporoflavus TaxID=28044 RepID=UPI00167CB746|nr:hypothetical protein [Streptomyces longisporoflavus]GGV72305.1 hypothetical protein GCM10010277_85000 [Streptomyces longisporoflavus]